MRRALADEVRRAGFSAAAGLLVLALACGGGGGGGGGPVGPDVTPPGVPISSRIVVDPPLPSALVRLTGSAGAVENGATVRLSNASAEQRTGQPVTASALAAADGAFAISVPAQLGDLLGLTAADAAGNVSGALELRAGPVPTTLSVAQPGGNQLLTLTTGEGAFNLPFPAGSERYTVVVQSLNPGAGTFPLTVAGSMTAEVRALGSAARAANPAGPEARIREIERHLGPTLPRGARGRTLDLSDDPEVGSTRTFRVVNRIDTVPDLTNPTHFDEVTARLRYKGDHTLLYVDTAAEGPNITDAVLEEAGERFDSHTYDIERAAFGPESDVDENGRIIVLLTPVVNSFNIDDGTESGVLTGFFYIIDLLWHPTFNPFANDAEIFYALVPDPGREFGGVSVPVNGYAAQLDGVLAHEFEHMINAGGRLAPGVQFETVWLDEALAHYAETLTGATFDGMDDFQNVLRSALWLQRPHAQSLVSGDDTLERRGVGWLLIAYLVDRHGTGILRQLVQGPQTGVPNVENVVDTSLPFLFHQFSSALFLDGQGVTSDPVFDIPSLDVRQGFQQAKQWWAGTPRLPGSYLDLRSAVVPGSLGSTGLALAGSSPAYFDVRASTAGTIPFIVRADRQSNLQVTVIRTQ